MRIVACLLALVSFAAVPSRALVAQSSNGSCPPVVADAARFGNAAVYGECAVTKPVKTRKVVEPRFTSSAGIICVTASLEFLVEADGKARLSSARVLETNAPEFAKLLIQSLEDWRFDPAQLDGEKVAQLVVVEHSQRASDAMGRTAYSVSAAGSSATPARPMISGKSAPCEP